MPITALTIYKSLLDFLSVKEKQFCFGYREAELLERKLPIHPITKMGFTYWQPKNIVEYDLFKYYLSYS